MTSTPFLVLVVALLFAYYRTDGDRVWRRRGLVFGAVPAVGGVIAATNTWSVPTVGGLALVTLTLAPATPRTLLPGRLAARLGASGPVGREAVRVGVALAAAAAVLAAVVAWSLPFWLTAVAGRSVTVFPDRSSLVELLTVHGAFLAVFAAYLYARGTAAVGPGEARIGALLGVAAVGVAVALDAAALGLFAPLVALGWLFSRRSTVEGTPDPARADGGTTAKLEGAAGDGRWLGFEAVPLVAGAGLVVLVEFVFVQEPTGRLNTVFKTYMQVWVLWSLAAGAALAWLLTRLDGRWRRRGARAGAALLVVSTATYGGLALTDQFTSDADIARTDDPTLDGLAWLETRHPGEAPAIRWLDAREGRPVILTAAPGGYRWNPAEGQGASAPASLTGLPTVLGWYHEAQYRGQAPYEQRLGAVEQLYGGPAGRQATLAAKHDLRYVYVGPAERAKYEVTIDERPWTSVAEAWPEVTIYRVDRAALQEAAE
jgi:YYY domain-containing protein